MSKKPIYRFRRIERDEEGSVHGEDGSGYGFSDATKAGEHLNVAEINIPDLLDEGDVVVISLRAGAEGGRSFTYLVCDTIPTKEDDGVLRSLRGLQTCRADMAAEMLAALKEARNVMEMVGFEDQEGEEELGEDFNNMKTRWSALITAAEAHGG